MPKVKDLIAKLQTFNPELEIVLNDSCSDDPIEVDFKFIEEVTTKNNCLQTKDSWEDPENNETGPFVADTVMISFD